MGSTNFPEGNSGGTGKGMQFQNSGSLRADVSELLSPIDINEPIEGVLIPDSEAKTAPVLRLTI